MDVPDMHALVGGLIVPVVPRQTALRWAVATACDDGDWSIANGEVPWFSRDNYKQDPLERAWAWCDEMAARVAGDYRGEPYRAVTLEVHPLHLRRPGLGV
jgi:hypothetical protein